MGHALCIFCDWEVKGFVFGVALANGKNGDFILGSDAWAAGGQKAGWGRDRRRRQDEWRTEGRSGAEEFADAEHLGGGLRVARRRDCGVRNVILTRDQSHGRVKDAMRMFAVVH